MEVTSVVRSCGYGSPSFFNLILGAFILQLLTHHQSMAVPVSRTSACYGAVNITAPRGIIGAPNFQGQGTGRKLCVWNITAPRSQVIFFRFLSFDIGLRQPKSACSDSILRIHNGAQWLLFCGTAPDASGYVTSSNRLVIELEHGGTRGLKRPRFSIQYRMYSPMARRRISASRSFLTNQGCHGYERTELRHGETYHLVFTKHQYSNNCDKTWRFLAPENTVIEMHVIEGAIEDGRMCAFDRLLAYGCRSHNCHHEPPEACNLLGSLCGNITSRTLRSNGNQLSLRFQTDGSVTDHGFLLTLTVYEAPEALTEEPEAKIDATCGLHGLPLANSRIVGGRVAPRGSLPWQVEISYGHHHLCGGALLSDNWVITAAHCVFGLSTPGDILVKAGDHTLGDGDDGDLEQRQSVRSVFIHCSYDPVTYDNDIAILELSRPFTYTNQTLPVCLPYDSDLKQGANCHIAGWGNTREGGELSPVLRYGTVNIISNKECLEQFASQGYSVQVTNNQVCATGIKYSAYQGDDACQGDSGGPMTLAVHYERTSLYGLVSWGIGCSRPGLSGVYTRLFNYLKWIDDITRGNNYRLEPMNQ